MEVVRLVGAFEVVAVWLSINNRTMVTKDLALGANHSADLCSSYRNQIWRAEQLRRAIRGSARTYACSIAAKVLVESAIASVVAFNFHSAL